MSATGFSRAYVFAILCCAASPDCGRAQSAVVRHSVIAEVRPVVAVRDSSWSNRQEIGAASLATWSGEIRANSASELQVMGPRNPEPPTYARIAGQWVRLEPGAWHTVIAAPAGRRVVTMELLYTPTDAASRLMPALRVIPR